MATSNTMETELHPHYEEDPMKSNEVNSIQQNFFACMYRITPFISIG